MSALRPRDPRPASLVTGLRRDLDVWIERASFQAHPEVEGSRSDPAHLIGEVAAARGVPPGEIYSRFAQLHGTLERCP